MRSQTDGRPVQFRKILVIAFDSNTARSLLRRIQPLASRAGVTLTLFSPIDAPDHIPELENASLSSKDLLSAMKRYRAEELDEALRDTLPKSQRLNVKVTTGNVFREVMREAREGTYDLVVKMAEGKGDIGALFFGTLDMKLLRKLASPLLIMKPSRRQTFGCILSAVQLDDDDLGDFSDQQGESFQFNADIIDAAATLALAENADLQILNAWEFFAEDFMKTKKGYRDEVRRILAEIKHTHLRCMTKLLLSRDLNGISFQSHVVKGAAADVIIKSANKFDADLIVMGTVGRVGIPGFIIGNTAETVLNNANCSVLALKPREFASPTF